MVEFPENAVSAAEINGIGLIHEISHFIIEKYVDEKDKNVFKELYQELTDKYTKDKLNKLLEIFLEEFPPLEIYKNNKEGDFSELTRKSSINFSVRSTIEPDCLAL